jgi:hypothetical protein
MERIVMGRERIVMGRERIVMGRERIVMGRERIVMGRERIVMGRKRIVMRMERIVTRSEIRRRWLRRSTMPTNRMRRLNIGMRSGQASSLKCRSRRRKKQLKDLAEDYILGSDRNIRVVIGLDIKYKKSKKATISVWRLQYVECRDGQEDLVSMQTVLDQVSL